MDKKLRFQCCACKQTGLTREEMQKHTGSVVHELQLAIEALEIVRRVEGTVEVGLNNAQAYIEAAMTKLGGK